jgi:uncharacterized repeat protein (TIGR03803 family)
MVGADGALYGTTIGGGSAGGHGTLFKIQTDGSGFTLLQSFSGIGFGPFGGLVQVAGGTLYGLTEGGGAALAGTLFEIQPDGSGFALNLSFNPTLTTFQPEGGLILGTDGALYGTTRLMGAFSGGGAVFKMQPDGTGFTVLHLFSGPDGADPLVGVIQGLDGALYGTTRGGGATGVGVVFRLRTDGSGFTQLHNFNSASDGYWPAAGLVQGADGTLYGTARHGGTGGLGTLFKLQPDGDGFTVLRSLGAADGSYPEASLLVGADGALYGTALQGGTSSFGTIFKLQADGTGFTVLRSFAGADGRLPSAGLVQGSNGTLYGTTSEGGTNGLGTVFKLQPDGTGFGLLHSFTFSDGSQPQAGVILGTDGRLYGTTAFGGAFSNQGAAFSVRTDGGGFALLHSFNGGDGQRPLAGLVEGPDGTLHGVASELGPAGGGGVFRLVPGDGDADGVADTIDNCPAAYNPLQENADNDALGDACDPDDDNDGLLDGADNCPLVSNPTQADQDDDGVGDACDADLCVLTRPAPRGASPALLATDEGAYCGDPTSGEILSLDFGGGPSTVVNTDAARIGKLGAVVVRSDVGAQHLIAADARRNTLLFYQDAEGVGRPITRIPLPRGLSLGPDGEIYLVSGRVRYPRNQGYRSSLWRVPRGTTQVGGYGPRELLDDMLPSRRLVATRVVSQTAGLLAAGDLLVVSQLPRTVFRYPRSGNGFGPRQVFLGPAVLPSDPTAIAFTPDGELLVSTTGGNVLRFDAGGNRLAPDFVTGLARATTLSVGIAGGEAKAFVGDGASVLRYRFLPDGTGLADGLTTDCGGDGGLGSGGEGSAPTPAGQDVEVQPIPELTLRFDDVTQAGLTTVKTLEFEDNRQASVCAKLSDFFPASPEAQAVLSGIAVPAHVRAFPKKLAADPPGGPYTGPETFILTIIDTTAQFARTAEVHEEEAERLGYAPFCSDADTTLRPRTFYAPEADPPKSEPALFEGALFTDFTSGCGSNIGRGSRFSLWLTARDTRPSGSIVGGKLSRLDGSIGFYAGLIEDTLEADLHTAAQAAQAAWAGTDVGATLLALAQVITLVDGTPSGFTTDPANVPGELIARAESAIYLIESTSLGRPGERRSAGSSPPRAPGDPDRPRP